MTMSEQQVETMPYEEDDAMSQMVEESQVPLNVNVNVKAEEDDTKPEEKTEEDDPKKEEKPEEKKKTDVKDKGQKRKGEHQGQHVWLDSNGWRRNYDVVNDKVFFTKDNSSWTWEGAEPPRTRDLSELIDRECGFQWWIPGDPTAQRAPPMTEEPPHSQAPHSWHD